MGSADWKAQGVTEKEVAAAYVDLLDSGETQRVFYASIPGWADVKIIGQGIQALERAGYKVIRPAHKMTAHEATAFLYGMNWCGAPFANPKKLGVLTKA